MPPIEITPAEVHLWETSLSVGDDEVQYDGSLLSPDERRYAARFTDARARSQFIVSRAKLRELLGKYAGQEPRDLRFGMTPEGKPFLSSSREFEFNLTHSGDLVLYGIAHSRPVGVDVERVREMPRAIELARRFMTAEDHERVTAAPPETRDREFLSLWVKREGSGKAYGVGVWKVLESGNKGGETPVRNQLFARITTGYACKLIDYSEQYVAAVAALGSDWRLVRRGIVRR
jgi:4'-phosphopantetheinyl transferase